ncbi:MAG: YkoF family thiamine/hydroxymethylpyrimidine-binding protein [Crocinitomicaceae bacterium]|tara:strand:+ start:1504 stop:1761 length:258 start_codon:yes stop_codon:yes gene_type:complete
MKVTIEISNYPLSEDYEPKILDFINRCQAHGMRTKVNATATHIQGDYETVMNLVQEEIKTSFEKYGQMIFVLKVLKGELDLDFSI